MLSNGRDLDRLLEPRSVAVVGASADPGKAGHQMVASLDDFPGGVFPVNPRSATVRGRRSYADIGAVPEAPDLAVLTLPAAATPEALQRCADVGVGAAVVCAGGFAEAGSEGERLQQQVADIVAATGMRVLGPNTSGFVAPHRHLRAVFLATTAALHAGRLSIVAQSGGFNIATCFLAHESGVGIRFAVGLGNAVDVGFVDVLDHLAADDGTGAILLHVEGVADGAALMEAVGRAVRRKPVVALKVGRADVSAFARSHTGSLVGDWELARSALKQAGAVIVEDMTELVDAGHVLANAARPAIMEGVGVVTAQAGTALALTDTLRTLGVPVPPLSRDTRRRLEQLLPPITHLSNPVDTGRPGPEFEAVLDVVAADPAISVLVVNALQEPGAVDLAKVVHRVAARHDIVTVCASGGPADVVDHLRHELETRSVPLFTAPERAARAVSALRDATLRVQIEPEGAPAQPVTTHMQAQLDEHSTKHLLREHGIDVPEGRRCTSREEAHDWFETLDSAAVLKGLVPGIDHKTEAGLVKLGITTHAQLDRAFDELDSTEADVDVYLLERLEDPGVELLVGGYRDPTWGTVIVLGAGGILADAIDRTVLRVAPISAAVALDAIASFPARKLLDGPRHLPAARPEDLARVLMGVSRLLLSHPHIAELDVNPLRITDRGPVALDALAVTYEESPTRPSNDGGNLIRAEG